MFRHKCTQLFRNGKMVKTRRPQPKEGKGKILDAQVAGNAYLCIR